MTISDLVSLSAYSLRPLRLGGECLNRFLYRGDAEDAENTQRETAN